MRSGRCDRFPLFGDSPQDTQRTPSRSSIRAGRLQRKVCIENASLRKSMFDNARDALFAGFKQELIDEAQALVKGL